MKTNRFHRCIRGGAIFISPTYFLIAALHLFFLPGFQQRPALPYTNYCKESTQSVYLLVRNDRSASRESRTIKALHKKAVHSYASLQVSDKPVLSAAIHHNGLFQYQPDQHDYWLRYRILRI